jgi:hypothetical protein
MLTLTFTYKPGDRVVLNSDITLTTQLRIYIIDKIIVSAIKDTSDYLQGYTFIGFSNTYTPSGFTSEHEAYIRMRDIYEQAAKMTAPKEEEVVIQCDSTKLKV